MIDIVAKKQNKVRDGQISNSPSIPMLEFYVAAVCTAGIGILSSI
jgi:hypothetical protein